KDRDHFGALFDSHNQLFFTDDFEGSEAVKNTIKSLVYVNRYCSDTLQLYRSIFEEPYLKTTQEYYLSESCNAVSSLTVSLFMRKVFKLIQ
ncbi:hypothetical protein HK096_005709, partial [Nowakowskiella sp. JEL0078]